MWASRTEAREHPAEPDTRRVTLEPRIVIWTAEPSAPPATIYPTALRIVLE